MHPAACSNVSIYMQPQSGTRRRARQNAHNNQKRYGASRRHAENIGFNSSLSDACTIKLYTACTFLVVQYFCCVKCKFCSLRHGTCLAVCLFPCCRGDKRARALLCITPAAEVVQRGFIFMQSVLREASSLTTAWLVLLHFMRHFRVLLYELCLARRQQKICDYYRTTNAEKLLCLTLAKW